MHARLIIFLTVILFSITLHAQTIGRGDPTAVKVGIHNGNRVRTIFNNYGVIAQPGSSGPALAWRYDANQYVGDVSLLVGLRLPYRDYDDDGIVDTIFSVVTTDVDGHGDVDYSPGGGSPRTFMPIPGFASDLSDGTDEVKGVAMSHQSDTWPSFWPDHPDWVDEDNNVEWNGYFGRGQLNADQESYYMMDDNEDDEMFLTYGFLPDSTDATRKGHALRTSVRGLQWSDFLAQDVIFWLYEISNIGTTNYDQVVFGTLIGTYIGLGGDEWSDDASFFDIKDNITYSWDFDNYISPAANPDWKPTPYDVGYVAYSFLESPGNQYDGIDNDGDDTDFAGELFTENDFESQVLSAGQKLILIEEDTFERTEFIMPNEATVVTSLGKETRLVPDSTILVEGEIDSQGNLNSNAYDGYDNDFDGVIDENYQLHYKQFKKSSVNNQVLVDTLNPVTYRNYFSAIIKNGMVDESRDDGVDNDNDWSKDSKTNQYSFDENGNYIDDVGADGKANTNDAGEYDGVPTDGEPNFDDTDVDESDQIGLTSFDYFVPSSAIDLSDENDMWLRMQPGDFVVPTSIQNNVAVLGEDGDFIYSSGYFPLLAGKTERFSVAISFGDDFEGVVKSKRIAQEIYDANYNFPKPPEMPTVSAVAGDGYVKLYWDKVAENSLDPVSREKDFEGYFVYKATDPDFSDAMTITDKDGTAQRLEPIAQFDLDNDIAGLFMPSATLYELRNGVSFYLGDNTGIQNEYTDYDVKNGVTYFYAVCAYDHGDASNDIYPAENSHYISTDIYGNITTDQNCAVVVPNAPVAGYVPPTPGTVLERIEGSSTAIPTFEIVDPDIIQNTTYEVSFIDSLANDIPIAYAYKVENTTDDIVVFGKNTHMKSKNNDVFDGVMLYFDTRYQSPDSIGLDVNSSGWNNENPDYLDYAVQPFDFPNYPTGIKETEDYAIVFENEYNMKSTPNLPGMTLSAKDINFKIVNISDPQSTYLVPFGFVSLDDTLSKGDRVILANKDTTHFTWVIEFVGDNKVVPVKGDTLFISILKPLNSEDKFIFTTTPATVDNEKAKDEINDVKVVPNPYVVSNIFEHPLSTQISGRGDRIIKFIHLPAGSKISIYTVRGNLVRTLRHESSISDGTVSWNLRNEEGLDVSYGIYFYVVEAPEIGAKKFGKIALIK
ncbi:MAG: hypothetical protein PVH88_18865 [Ignavibacteria bacterium]